MPNQRICVIIRHQNHLQDTLTCLQSLSQVVYPRFTTLVIHDNRALEPPIRAQFPRTLLSLTNIAIQSAASYNASIQWALSKPFSWILLLSNEATVDPHFLSAFLQEAKTNPDAKIFGAKIFDAANPSRVLHLGGMWDAEHATYESYCEQTESVDYVSLDAFFMHRTVPQTIGLFEPKYQLHWEDLDYCFRAKRKGLLTRIAPDAKIWCKAKNSTPYFWYYGRYLWMKRNLTQSERQKALKNSFLLGRSFFFALRAVLLSKLRNRSCFVASFFFCFLLWIMFS